MLTRRQELILKLLIEEHVETAEPIGSRNISKNDLLNVSAATIRNEMSDLESLGFLKKTHTSSGRVPSEDGYRYYVNNLLNNSTNDFKMIDTIFKNKKSTEEIIEESIHFISNLTNYASFAMGNKNNALIKKIDLTQLSQNESVLVIITNDGNVRSKKISIPYEINITEMRDIVRIISEIVINTPLNEVADKLIKSLQVSNINKIYQYRNTIIENFITTFNLFAKQNTYYQSGKTNILKQPEFNDLNKFRNIINFMDENNIFKLIDVENDGITVKIGSENNIKVMKDCTLISIPYIIEGNKTGRIAVVGPTRMEYKKVIPLLEYVAKNMNKFRRD